MSHGLMWYRKYGGNSHMADDIEKYTCTYTDLCMRGHFILFFVNSSSFQIVPTHKIVLTQNADKTQDTH